jgi:hypothetical protein
MAALVNWVLSSPIPEPPLLPPHHALLLLIRLGEAKEWVHVSGEGPPAALESLTLARLLSRAPAPAWTLPPPVSPDLAHLHGPHRALRPYSHALHVQAGFDSRLAVHSVHAPRSLHGSCV